MPYASLACDMTSASEVAVAAWGALQVLYAFAFAYNQAQIRESPPVKDRHPNHWATPPIGVSKLNICV